VLLVLGLVGPVFDPDFGSHVLGLGRQVLGLDSVSDVHQLY